jgi:hypothetical protein
MCGPGFAHQRASLSRMRAAAGNVLVSADGSLRLADFSESLLFKEAPLLRNQAR